MSRLCERPGCSEPGAVAYGMNAPDLVFWVEALRPNGDTSGAQVLCRRHADTMVVPRGWTLDDRREPVPRLFRPPSAPSGAAGERREPSRRRRPAATEPLPLDDTPGQDAPGDDAPVDDAPVDAAPVWAPNFDPDDDLDGLLRVDSPLLSRAFRGARRRDGAG